MPQDTFMLVTNGYRAAHVFSPWKEDNKPHLLIKVCNWCAEVGGGIHND